MNELLTYGDKITCTMSNGMKYIVTPETPEALAYANELLLSSAPGWEKYTPPDNTSGI